MILLCIISVILVSIFGFITSYTDIRYKKAYNKVLIFFMPAGLGIQISSMVMSSDIVPMIIANMLAAIIISAVFYARQIWAAGDAKVFMIVVSLIAYRLYSPEESYTLPALYIIGFTFTIAVIYIMLESLVLFICELRVNKKIKHEIKNLNFSTQSLLTWLLAFLAVDSFDNILFLLRKNFIFENRILLAITNILFTIAIMSLIKNKFARILSLMVIAVIRIFLMFFIAIPFPLLSFANIFVVLITVCMRRFAERYNNRTIKTSDIKAGDVLTREAIIFMLPSKVNGLPNYTDETTRCRISQSEADAIKRWEKSKYGLPDIKIVRTIPFTPFIFLGTIICLIFLNFWGV